MSGSAPSTRQSALHEAATLAGEIPGGDTVAGKAAASGNFGNGQAGGPAFPVPARGRQKLLELLAIAAVSLLLVIVAMWRLIAGRGKGGRAVAAAGPPPSPGLPGQAGSGGTAEVHYPTQIYPAQPFRQGRPAPGYFVHAGQTYPIGGHLGQPGPPGPGQPPPKPRHARSVLARRRRSVPARCRTSPGSRRAASGLLRPGSARPGSARPGSARPGSARPGIRGRRPAIQGLRGTW